MPPALPTLPQDRLKGRGSREAGESSERGDPRQATQLSIPAQSQKRRGQGQTSQEPGGRGKEARELGQEAKAGRPAQPPPLQPVHEKLEKSAINHNTIASS